MLEIKFIGEHSYFNESSICQSTIYKFLMFNDHFCFFMISFFLISSYRNL